MVFTIVAFVAGSILLIFMLVLMYRRQNPSKTKGKTRGRAFARDKVVGAARSFAGRNSFRVISPATISRNGATAQLDAIVVGYFGVLGVISLGYSGEVYGAANEETWLQVDEDGTRTRFKNPIDEAAAAVRVIRDALFSQKMKKIPVEVVYVFANPDAQLALPRSIAPLRLPQFKNELKRERYLEDCGLDMDNVEKVLREAVEKAD